MQPRRMIKGGMILVRELVRKEVRVGEEGMDMSVRSSAMRIPELMLIPIKAGITWLAKSGPRSEGKRTIASRPAIHVVEAKDHPSCPCRDKGQGQKHNVDDHRRLEQKVQIPLHFVVLIGHDRPGGPYLLEQIPYGPGYGFAHTRTDVPEPRNIPPLRELIGTQLTQQPTDCRCRGGGYHQSSDPPECTLGKSGKRDVMIS